MKREVSSSMRCCRQRSKGSSRLFWGRLPHAGVLDADWGIIARGWQQLSGRLGAGDRIGRRGFSIFEFRIFRIVRRTGNWFGRGD